MHHHRAPIAILLVLALTMIACSQGQITTAIQVAISAAEIAIPLVGSQTNLDPAILSSATKYLDAANSSLGTVTTILESGDSAAVQAAKITTALSGVATVNLPPGTPQNVASAINNVASAVTKVLSNFAQPNGKPKLMKPGTKIKLTPGDHKALAEAKLKLAKNAEALKTLKR